jgi:alcohol dehydrogenase class IV
MLKKHLLKISLLLPLVAISATAHAGSTITDKSYWPSEARRTAYGVTAPQNNPRSAFADDRGASHLLQPTPNMNDGGSSPHYHGGPKYPW